MEKLLFGWAEEDITPKKKVALDGQFAERISEYVEKPLTVTALTLKKGEEHVIFVSCDLVGVSTSMVEAVRDELCDNTLGIRCDNIVLSAIHTHTGPIYRNARPAKKQGYSITFRSLLQSMLPVSKKYVEKVNITSNEDICTISENFDLILEKIVKAIKASWENLREGSYANGFGRAPVGMCRRAVYTDGSAQMWGNTETAFFTELEGGNDSGIELLYVYDDRKELSGIVANLACPAQCVQHRLFVSPDFWGEVKVLLRKHFGKDIFLLPQCSAAGDQCPVDLVRWVEPDSDLNDPNITRENPSKRRGDPSMFDIQGMKKAGKRIANEIIEVFENELCAPIEDAILTHEMKELSLPLRQVTMEDVKRSEAAIKAYLAEKEGDVCYNDAAKLQQHLGVLRRAKLQERQSTVAVETHVVRLGSIAFVTNPFELFLNYGNQIKARSHAEQTFIVQLANGCMGYLPTKKAEDGGHYSAFVSSGQVGHAGGDLLVKDAIDRINDTFKE